VSSRIASIFCTDLRAAAVEGLHGDLEAGALGHEGGLPRDTDVLEDHLGGVGRPLAEFVLHAVFPDAGEIGREHEGRDAGMARLPVTRCKGDVPLRHTAVRNEMFWCRSGRNSSPTRW
jgi:hypothetical protein